MRASDVGYREALESLREIGAVRDVALAAMDRVVVAADPDAARTAAGEARAIWQRLGARAMLDRLDELLARRSLPAEVGSRTAPATSEVAV
jgi:hypothetical protein